MVKLPVATIKEASAVDAMLEEVAKSLEFAAAAIAKGDWALAADSLTLARGMIDVATAGLPVPAEAAAGAVAGGAGSQSLAGSDLTAADITNVKTVVERMAAADAVKVDNVEQVLSRLDEGGFDVAGLEDRLQENDATTDQVVVAITRGAGKLQAATVALNDVVNDPAFAGNMAAQAGDIVAKMDIDWEAVASAVTEAVVAGVGFDLDALAQDAGFGSFADAVGAYNEAFGTDYSVDQARDALGL